MKRFERIEDKRLFSSTASKPPNLTILEQLEPRILLSGEGLLSIDTPDPFPDNTQPVVQYAELLEEDEQVETDLFQPIITLSVEDGSVQAGQEPTGFANDSGENVDDRGTLIGAVEVAVDDQLTTNISAVPTEDGSMPIYTNDTDSSSECASSIEIRGPPTDTGVGSTISDLGAYVTSDVFFRTSKVDCSHQFWAPDLPGLHCVEPDISSWEGQIIYLDFDGAEDVTYNGPVTVGPFDIPAFQAPGELDGQEQKIINQVLAELEQIFAGTGIIFTITQPLSGVEYSTIYIGGGDVAFSEYGSFIGLAEQVDIGNQNQSDRAFVFSDELYLGRVGSVISHEVGHLLGYEHDEETSSAKEQILTNVAAVTLENIITELPENTDTSSRIKVADIVVDDLGTYVLGLSGAATSLFEIDGLELYLKAGVTLNYETAVVPDINDPTCVAFWRFEDGALGSDSIGTNQLFIEGITANTSDFIEGEASAEFPSTANRLYCRDSDLDSDFPMKSDNTQKDITTIQWIKFSDLGPSGHISEFWAKYKEDNVSYRLSAINDGTDTKIRISIGYQDPFLQEHVPFPTPVVTDRWYFIASTFQYSTRTYRVRIYDYTAGEFLDDDLVGIFTHDVIVGNGIFDLGHPSETFDFRGLMDACIVYNRVLSVEELELIRMDMYGENWNVTPTMIVAVTVDYTDAGTPDDTELLSIMVTDVNDAPTVSLVNTVTSLSEIADTTNRTKVADIVISDDNLGTNVLSLNGADASLFVIDNAALYLMAGVSLNFDINPTLDVTVEVNDATVGTTPDDTAPLSIAITDYNFTPALDTNNGATVAGGGSETISNTKLKVTDVDNTADELQFTLTAIPTHGLLKLDGTTLSVSDTFTQADIDAGLLTYEHDGSETDSDSFQFTVSDGSGGNIGETTFNITIFEVKLDLDAKSKAQFYDADGDLVTVTLKGSGTGTLYFVNDGPCDIEYIELTGTTEKSSLTITTKGSTTIKYIIVHGSLKSITAKTTDLLGNITVEGWVGSILIDDVTDDHVIIISGSNGAKPITLKFDEVADLTIGSDTPIKSLTVTEWIGGSITTPWISSLSVKGGDFNADVMLNGSDNKGIALKKLTVAGRIIDSNIIVQNGSAGTMTAGALWNSNLVCATISEGQEITLSNLEESIVPGSRIEIKKLTIKGIKNDNSNCFINSNIAAANLGSISLLFPQYDNSGVPFGLVADFIKKVNITDNVGRKSFKNLSSPGDSIQDQDCEICLV